MLIYYSFTYLYSCFTNSKNIFAICCMYQINIWGRQQDERDLLGQLATKLYVAFAMACTTYMGLATIPFGTWT